MPKPVLRIDLRNCLGMMASVSTFSRSIGATRPLCTLNFCITSSRLRSSRVISLDFPDVDEVAMHRGRRGHRGTDQVGATAGALAAFEVAVAGGGAALAR